jgi:hypothetical protein
VGGSPAVGWLEAVDWVGRGRDGEERDWCLLWLGKEGNRLNRKAEERLERERDDHHATKVCAN